MSDQQTEPRQRRSWTAGEDSTLYHEVKRTGIFQGTSNDWNAVAAKLPRRTNKDCRKRWLKICKLVNKGTWSTEEDERLLQAVEDHGQSWIQVAQSVETRHADQCAKRWHTVLCQGGVFAQAWTSQNDEYLIHAVELYGRKWRLIAEQYFQGRSAADVRNRHIALTGRPAQEMTEAESSTPSVDLSSLDDIGVFFETDEDMSFNFDQDHNTALQPSFDALDANNSHDLCQQIMAEFPEQLAPGTSAIQDMSSLDPQLRESYTTLMLTDVQPRTLSEVMGILMRDRVKVSMSLNGS